MIITITLIHCPTSLCAEDEQYNNCSTTFQCGGLKKNLSYPFWGSNRAEYCGHPSFWLDCSNDVPLINITHLNYRVLDININLRTLRLARTDYWETICPAVLGNTTIDFSLFSYTSSINLTLYYNCLSPLLPGSAPTLNVTKFDCSINSTNSAYYMSYLATDLLDTPLGLCGYHVNVPILESAGLTYTTEDAVTAAIDGGFMLGWNANNTQCDQCLGAGGLCGYNTTTSAFACHCASGTFASGCSGITGKYPCHFSYFILAILQ
jgi:hypothetical protein